MVKTPYKSKSYESKDWQDFERLVALVEKRLAPAGAVVTYNDRIPPLVPSTRRPIQVDASIRMDVGSTTILVTIEARFKSRRQGTAWIEQLATRREEIGASKTIAVTNKGFDASVHELAARKGIELRVLNQITEDDIDGWAQIPSMIHAHRYVKSIESFVELMDGELVEIDAMEACFRHPEVHSPFPAVAFVAFADIRAPGTVWNTPVDGSAATAELVFDGQNPELMPVPLGHKRPFRKGLSS